MSKPVMLDAIERIAIVVFFSVLTLNLLRGFQDTGNPANAVLLASEFSIVLFVLFRRSTTKISSKPSDWLFAVFGSVLPLLVQPTGLSPSVPVSTVCVVLMLAGFTIQITAKLILRRSFGAVAANRGVKVGGPYRLVRHPMYAGYVLTHIGFLIGNPSLWNFTIYGIGFGIQLARILAEERILFEDEAYRRFAAKTQYRLLPGVF